MRTAERDQAGYRTVSGRITGSGAVVAGTGFAVTRTAAGTYTVRLTPPLRSVHSITATVEWGAGNYVAALDAVAPDSFVIRTKESTTGIAADVAPFFTVRGIA